MKTREGEDNPPWSQFIRRGRECNWKEKKRRLDKQISYLLMWRKSLAEARSHTSWTLSIDCFFVQKGKTRTGAVLAGRFGVSPGSKVLHLSRSPSLFRQVTSTSWDGVWLINTSSSEGAGESEGNRHNTDYIRSSCVLHRSEPFFWRTLS